MFLSAARLILSGSGIFGGFKKSLLLVLHNLSTDGLLPPGDVAV